MQKQGKRYGELAAFVRSIGQCQARHACPGPCATRPERKELEVCHAGSKGSGQYDWVTDPSGERIGNLWLGCPFHHDWADEHKGRYLEWMKRVARANGVAAIAAGVEPVL
jgi:hypothetical protein